MKTPLQKQLAQIAPSISIQTIWEHDPDHYDIRKDCEGFDNEDPADWQAWQSEIRATAIIEGEQVIGSAHLGATWEKAGDDPRVSNPDISGYEPQMTEEALQELAAIIGENHGDCTTLDQIAAAIAAIEAIPA